MRNPCISYELTPTRSSTKLQPFNKPAPVQQFERRPQRDFRGPP